MTIDKILKLEASNVNIRTINNYLSKTDVDSIEHAQAASHLASLYYSFNQIEEAIYVIETILERYNKDNKIILLSTLINITKNDKEVCLSNILRKKELLESFNQSLYYEDMIMYHKDNMDERIKYINLYLQDDISREDRLKGLYLLAETYFDNNLFEKFRVNLETAKESSLELRNNDYYEAFIYFEAATFFKEEDTDRAIKILNSHTPITNNFGNMLNLLKLEIYFKLENFKKCTILEVDYEEFMVNASKEIQERFYNICIELYQKTKNNFSLKSYQAKLDKLNEQQKFAPLEIIKDEVIKPVKIKEQKEVKEVKVKETKSPLFKTIKKVTPTLNEMNDFYQDTVVMYQPFYTPNEFREQLRLSLTKLNEQVLFKECIILTKNNDSFLFKKERLYNKTKNINFEMVDRFHHVNTEIISFNTDKDNLLDPFTNEKFEHNTTVIFPLFAEECFGVIYFLSDSDALITGTLNFEKLHSFAKFYNSIVLLNNDKENVIKENKAKLEILHAKNFYYGYVEDNTFYPSEETTSLFDIKKSVMFSTLLSKIHTDDYYSFHHNFNLLTLENNYLEQLLSLNNDKKVLFKITMVDDFKYLFIFEDYTKIEDNKQMLITKAYNNPITNLKNNQALKIEITQYFEMKKFSSILLNFKDLKKYTYLYGEKFSLDVLKYIGKILPKYNEDYDYYHLNFDKLIIVIPNVNDKRALKSIVKKIDDYLIENLTSINERLTPRFNYGVYRAGVDTKEKTIDKMLEILSDAIINSNELYEDNVGFYDIELYKSRFRKEQLVTYISESLDQRSINVLYSQCVNIKNNLVEFYEVKLNLNKYKVDDSVLEEVIKRRSLTTAVEQYLIQRTFHEMNLIYDKTNYSINVMINIDEYSLTKSSFINYVDALADQFKINKTAVVFKVDKIYASAVENISYLIKNGYQVALSNLEDLSLVKPNYFILNNFKHSNEFNDEYIKSLSNILGNLDVKFILNNTKKNEVIEHYQQYIDLFKGDVYKQQLTYLDIVNIFKQTLQI